MELYKTLEFKDIKRDTFGKYAHPIEFEKGMYVWCGSSIPLLITTKTTINKLKQFYKGLDFEEVSLVSKKLVDFSIKQE